LWRGIIASGGGLGHGSWRRGLSESGACARGGLPLRLKTGGKLKRWTWTASESATPRRTLPRANRSGGGRRGPLAPAPYHGIGSPDKPARARRGMATRPLTVSASATDGQSGRTAGLGRTGRATGRTNYRDRAIAPRWCQCDGGPFAGFGPAADRRRSAGARAWTLRPRPAAGVSLTAARGPARDSAGRSPPTAGPDSPDQAWPSHAVSRSRVQVVRVAGRLVPRDLGRGASERPLGGSAARTLPGSRAGAPPGPHRRVVCRMQVGKP
jgi:hypothetical protein